MYMYQVRIQTTRKVLIAVAARILSRIHHDLLCAAVRQEQIPGKAGRCIYDSTVDRDLVVLADDVASLPESPPEVDKPKSIEDAVQKMSSLLGRGMCYLTISFLSKMMHMPVVLGWMLLPLA